MDILIATICLMIGLTAGIFVLRPRTFRTLDVAIDQDSAHESFTLADSLLIIGPRMNDAACAEQRKEVRRILQPLLSANYKIIEIYGENAPTENGQPYEWLDAQLMRRTLSAEDGFHLIHLDKAGRTAFHSGQPIVAEALLHILDLWDQVAPEHEEALIDVSPEEPAADANERREPPLESPVPHLTLVNNTLPDVPEDESVDEAEDEVVDETGEERKAPQHIAKAVRNRLRLN